MKKKFKKVLASAMAGIMALSVMMSPGLGTKVAKAAGASVEYESEAIKINKVEYDLTLSGADNAEMGDVAFSTTRRIILESGNKKYPFSGLDMTSFDALGFLDGEVSGANSVVVVNSITINDTIVFKSGYFKSEGRPQLDLSSGDTYNSLLTVWSGYCDGAATCVSEDGKYVIVGVGKEYDWGKAEKLELHKVSENQPPIGPFLDITLEQADNGIAIISADEAQMYQKVYLTQEADDGYGFKEWQVKTDEATPRTIKVNKNMFIMPDTAVTVTPVFAKKYAIKVTDDGNGTGEASVDSEVAGKNVTLKAKPNAGYKFVKWEVVKGNIAITDNKFKMPDTEVEVRAIYEVMQTSTAFFMYSGSGLGDVFWDSTKAPDSAKTEVSVVEGGTYTLTYNLPDGADEVADTNVMCIDIAGANAKIQESKLELTALSLKVDGKDVAVNLDKILTGDIESNTNFRIEINNQYGATKKDPAIKTDDVKFSKSISVTFTLAVNNDTTERDIKVTTSGKGTASASVAKAMFGTEVTLTAKPEEGYYFKGWEVKSGNVKISEDNKFTMQKAAVEIEAVFVENPKVDTSKPADYHAYMCFQTPAYTFRNAWSDADYGLNGKNLLKDGYNVAYGWDNGNQVVKPGKFTDVNITKDGTYTVSVTDMDTTYEFESQKFMNLIFVSTDIPNVDSIKITDVVLKVNGKEVKVSPVLDPKDKDYKQLICQSTYYKNGDDVPVLECGEYDVPVKSIEVTFTVTGVENLVLPAKKGASVKTAEGTFKVTSTDVNAPTVAFTAPKSKTATSVTIPATIKDENGVTYKVTSVAANAFAKNTKVKKVEIGKNVKTIGAGAFSGCTKLATVTFKGTAVTSIGKNAFKGDKALKSIVITKKVKTIGASAFEGCTKLAKVTMKSTKLATVGNKAFAKCTSLKSLTFPASCKKLGASVFTGNKKLKTLTLKSAKMTTKTLNKNTFKGTVKTIKVKVPSKKVAAYKKLFATKGLNKKAKVTK